MASRTSKRQLKSSDQSYIDNGGGKPKAKKSVRGDLRSKSNKKARRGRSRSAGSKRLHERSDQSSSSCSLSTGSSSTGSSSTGSSSTGSSSEHNNAKRRNMRRSGDKEHASKSKKSKSRNKHCKCYVVPVYRFTFSKYYGNSFLSITVCIIHKIVCYSYQKCFHENNVISFIFFFIVTFVCLIYH